MRNPGKATNLKPLYFGVVFREVRQEAGALQCLTWHQPGHTETLNCGTLSITHFMVRLPHDISQKIR